MAHRTFVGFSSTDIKYFRLMLAWKANENMDFDFINCQLAQEVDSENEGYIKRKCRERIDMAGTFISLIGDDTRRKHKFVRWELEVALEKKCRIIAVNLCGSRQAVNETCPPIINDIGAVFVPFSSRIVDHALKNFDRKEKGNWHYKDHVYRNLGYV